MPAAARSTTEQEPVSPPAAKGDSSALEEARRLFAQKQAQRKVAYDSPGRISVLHPLSP